MALVLKMRLQRATRELVGDPSVNYQLFAVTGEENKPWSKYTPGGQLQFTVNNPDCPALEAGDYLVTLEKV